MSTAARIVKKFAPDLAAYSKASFFKDLAAGITVGIVALPLSLALAIATGVPPIVGLYTAGIAGTLASVFAGSRFSISGPAAAMVPVLAGIIQQFGTDKLLIITLIAAAFLVLFGLIGVGKLITKIPESVVLGFTAGIAIVIIAGQLNSFLGLTGIESHEHFADKFIETLTQVFTVSWPALLVGILSLAIIIWAPKIKYFSKIPATLVAVTAATLLVQFIPALSGVATLSEAYGAIAMGLPTFSLPTEGFSPEYILPAFKIALLIAVETLLCAMVADRLTKTKHNPSQELLSQGIGNLGSALFGGIPSTAVIARTGTAIKNNAASRLTGIIHGLTVIAFLAILAPLANSIPLAALSAVLIVTAIRISEYKEVWVTMKKHALDFDLTLITTLVLTVLTDLTIGVAAGIIMYILRRKVLHRAMEGRRSLLRSMTDDAES
jgi:sulfate permease, SulP family